VRGLAFNGVGRTKGGICSEEAGGLDIGDCLFYECKTGIYKDGWFGIYVHDNFFFYGQDDFVSVYSGTDGGNHAGSNYLERNYFSAARHSSIFLHNGGSGSNTYIKGGVIEQNFGFGIIMLDATAISGQGGMTIENVWFEANGKYKTADPCATVVVDGNNVEPLDMYIERCAGVVLRNNMVPNAWVKTSTVTTHSCYMIGAYFPTGAVESMVALDDMVDIQHYDLGLGWAGGGHTNFMTHGVRVDDASGGTYHPVSVRTEHKTFLDRSGTNLLANGDMAGTFSPSAANGRTNSMVAANGPLYGKVWQVSLNASEVGSVKAVWEDCVVLWNNPIGAIDHDAYYVWSVTMRSTDNDASLSLRWEGMYQIIEAIKLKGAGEWVTYTGINHPYGAVVNSAEVPLWNTAANTVTLQVSQFQMRKFTTLQEAMNYANSNAYTPYAVPSSEKLLDSGVALMQAGDAKTTIYTVPAGLSAIVTKVIVRNPSGSLAGGSDFDLGDGANATTWKQNNDLSGMTATTDCIVIFPTAQFTVFNAADAFGIKPGTGATADVTATVMVYGIEY
jgi:hypothetical protein